MTLFQHILSTKKDDIVWIRDPAKVVKHLDDGVGTIT